MFLHSFSTIKKVIITDKEKKCKFLKYQLILNRVTKCKMGVKLLR